MTKLKPVSEVESEDELDTAFLGEVGSAKASVWSTTLQLNGHKIQFKLDTGAGATAISMETYNVLQRPKLKTPKMLLYGPSRQPLDCIGEFQGRFAYDSKSVTQPVYVVKGLRNNLLGLPAIMDLQLVIRVDESKAQSAVTTDDYKKQFPSLFTGLGNLGEPFEIHLKDGGVPHSVYTPRNVPCLLERKSKQN